MYPPCNVHLFYVLFYPRPIPATDTIRLVHRSRPHFCRVFCKPLQFQPPVTHWCVPEIQFGFLSRAQRLKIYLYHLYSTFYYITLLYDTLRSGSVRTDIIMPYLPVVLHVNLSFEIITLYCDSHCVYIRGLRNTLFMYTCVTCTRPDLAITCLPTCWHGFKVCSSHKQCSICYIYIYVQHMYQYVCTSAQTR